MFSAIFFVAIGLFGGGNLVRGGFKQLTRPAPGNDARERALDEELARTARSAVPRQDTPTAAVRSPVPRHLLWFCSP